MSRLWTGEHRPRVLAVLGLIWVLIGVGLAINPPVRRGLVYESWPVWLRVGLWLLPGMVAITAKFARRLDVLAWCLLMIPVAERAAAYAVGWAFGTVDNAWLGFAAYIATVVLVYECAAGLDRLPKTNGEGEEWWRRRVSPKLQ